MRLSGTLSRAISTSRGFGNQLYDLAGERPSLDLQFSDQKSLVDAATGSQLVTFTRASSGTYVDSQGVIRTATTNLLLRSNEFDITWANSNSSETAAAGIALDGTNTAWELRDTVDASAVVHNINQAVSITSGTTYTMSVHLKKGTLNFGAISFPSAGFTVGQVAIFDINTGTVSSTTGGGTARITPLNNGWYRCSLTATATATVASTALNIRTSTSTSSTYQGDGTGTILIWGAQLEQSSTVGEYIPTTSTINSAPRFDHNPTTGESLGLLVEEQRTNSVRNNTMVGAVAGTPGTLPTNWIGAGSSGLAREVVGTGTESGIAYVDVRYFGTTTSALFQNVAFEVSNQIAAAQSSIWTSTAFVKLVGGSLANITSVKLVMDSYSSSNVSLGQYAINNFAPTTAALVTQRYSVSSTSSTFSNAATAFVRPYLQFEAGSGVAIDITLRIGLPQLEQGAFATSVIPTTTAAATRNADVASITGTAFSSWYRQDEGTVYFSAKTNFAVPSGPFPRVVQIQGATGSDRIEQSFFNGGQVCYLRNSAAIQAEWYPNYFIQNGVTSSFALATNNIAGSSNGVITGTDSVAVLPTVDRMIIGAETSFGNFLNGTIRRLTYFPTRLPNSTLQQITQ